MSHVAVIAKLTCKPGCRDEAVALFRGHVDHVGSEEGTVVYALHTDAGDEVTIWFYETYRDQDALKAHGGADAMKALGPKLAPLLDGRAQLHFLTPIAAKGL